jgi:HEPN domain-containing protein
MNRSDFQELAQEHLRHAKALLDAGLYSGAYYMCGYVVECALKACICKGTGSYDFYPHPTDAKKAWSHKFKDLIGLTEVSGKIKQERRGDNTLHVYWKVVEGWSAESRYDKRPRQREAEDLFTAVSDPVHGVPACIKRHW